MRLLERYVFLELVRVFGILVTIATSLLVFVGAIGQAKEHELGYWQVLQILPFVLPLLLPFTIPATLLLSACVVYGRMAGDNEIIAARAAGISVFVFLWPSFFLGGLLSVASLLISDQVIPWAASNVERVITLAMEDILLDQLRTQNAINRRENGITITVTGVRDRTLIEPVIRYTRGKSAIIVQASSASLTFDLPRQQVWLELHGAQSHLSGFQHTAYLEYDRIPFPLPRRDRRLSGSNLRIEDIRKEIERLAENKKHLFQSEAIAAAMAVTTGDYERLMDPEFKRYGNLVAQDNDTILRLDCDMHNRFAMAMSCLFFVLLGAPFAVLMARKQLLTSFLFCFLPILIVYYPITMMSQNLSKTGALDANWAVWTANAVLGIVGSYFLRKVTLN